MKYIRFQSEKKGGVNHDIEKIGKQMLKFQSEFNVQIRILSSTIFYLVLNQ